MTGTKATAQQRVLPDVSGCSTETQKLLQALSPEEALLLAEYGENLSALDETGPLYGTDGGLNH